MSVLKKLQRGWIAYTGLAAVCGYSAYTLVSPIFHLGRKQLELLNEDGTPIPVSYSMGRINIEVLQKIDMDAKVLAKYDLFTCKGVVPTHIGSLHGRGGCVVGVPQTFYYQSSQDVDCVEELCQFYNISKDDITVILNNLKEALTLSANAKKFALACELYSANTYKGISNIVMLCVAFQLGYTAMYYIEKYLKPSSFMRSVYVLIFGLLLIRLYFEALRFYTKGLQSELDKKSAKIGDDFAAGGIEFYEKCDQIEKLLLPYKEQPNQVKSFISSVTGNSSIDMPPSERKAQLEQFIFATKKDQTT